MTTVKKPKTKNISSGPSKKTSVAPKVDPQGQYTKVQERTLGNMKIGGSLDKKKSFPDLNKDGKITKADILVGKGVIKAKSGAKVKDKNWIQSATASIKKRGTEGKCTPITKKGCSGKAKTLALTFKKISKKK